MTLQRLNRHLNMVLKLQEATEILSSLQSQSAGVAKFDGMPHAHEASRSTENVALALRAYIETVNRLEETVHSSEKEVREFVDSIEDPKTQIIFDLHFLCGMKWEAVSRMIGGGHTKDTVRQTCYRYLGEKPEEDGF